MLAFLAVWLTFWTAGGIAAFIQLLHADWGTRLFLLLWLCFWAFGESTAATIIAWQLFGRELLLVSRERLEVRKLIGRLTKTKPRPRSSAISRRHGPRVTKTSDHGKTFASRSDTTTGPCVSARE